MKIYPKLNIGVGGLVLLSKTKILLIKRCSDLSVWTIPSGYLKSNESLFDTIKRETKEETSVAIKPKGIIGLRQRISKKEGNNLWLIVLADYKTGKVKPDGFEIAETQFITITKALKENLTPVTKQLIKLLKKKELKIFLPQKNIKQKNYNFFV